MTEKAKKQAKEKGPAVPGPEVAHDDSDIAFGRIMTFTGVVVAVTVYAMIAMWVFTRDLIDGEKKTHTAPPPMTTELPDAPPDPRLQSRPKESLQALRDQEAAILETYGWEDRDRGVVRIPIRRAIEILAERGLPARKEGPPAEDPVSQPTDSSIRRPQ